MKKSITLYVMGEKFEIFLEEEFFEYIKDDLIKIQNPTPRDLLFFILEKNKNIYEIIKKIENLKGDDEKGEL